MDARRILEGRRWQPSSTLLWLLLCLRVGGSLGQTVMDVSQINSPESLCNNDLPSGLGLPTPVNVTVASENGVHTVKWITHNDPGSIAGVQILYWPQLSTLYSITSDEDYTSAKSSGVMIRDTRAGTTYFVRVRLYAYRASNAQQRCYSAASSPMATFDTVHAAPGAKVQNVQIENPYEGSDQTVLISWSPIPDDQWNGNPYGYSLFLSNSSSSGAGAGRTAQFNIPFPMTSFVSRNLSRGQYVVEVAPVNSVFVGETSDFRTFTIGDGFDTGSGETFGNSPFIYIIVPGIVFSMVVIVVSIVICKKTKEKRKRSVSYVKDISERMAHSSVPPSSIQMRTFSTNSATALIQSPSTGHARPLPLSPNSANSGGSPTNCQYVPDHESPVFFTAPSAGAPPRKQPHPGFIPPYLENHAPFSSSSTSSSGTSTVPMHRVPTSEGRIPMHRVPTTESTSSVFTNTIPADVFAPPAQHPVPMQQQQPGPMHPVPMQQAPMHPVPMQQVPMHPVPVQQAHVPMQQAQPPQGQMMQQSARGQQRRRADTVPSPYEVPEGSTLGRNGSARPSAAAAHASQFPPPPQHSPPPLTQSSLEIFARMSGRPGGHASSDHAGQRPYRSFSTSSADAAHVEQHHPKQHGLLQHPSLDTHLEKAEEAGVFLQPPLESSGDNSVGSGGTARPAGGYHKQGTLERERGAKEYRSPPPVEYSQYNGSVLSGSSSFSEMTDPSLPGGSIQRFPYNSQAPPGQRMRTGGRGRNGSDFSDTSTEMTASSMGSTRGLSPPSAGHWEHGAMSELGGAHRMPSRSPEHFNEVGETYPSYQPQNH